ncbi:hypothetical protein CMI47_12330 [Candidatus Pacearchaeota archaeon]|nr:hypothetical protein [Candidatus Pacearchaeota archaeon]
MAHWGSCRPLVRHWSSDGQLVVCLIDLVDGIEQSGVEEGPQHEVLPHLARADGVELVVDEAFEVRGLRLDRNLAVALLVRGEDVGAPDVELPPLREGASVRRAELSLHDLDYDVLDRRLHRRSGGRGCSLRNVAGHDSRNDVLDKVVDDNLLC